MEKHVGLIESLAAFQPGHEHTFCMPAHSGRYISADFKRLLDQQQGYWGIEAARSAFSKVPGYSYKDGVLQDMGPMYHQAFSADMTLLVQNGSTNGNHIVTYCLARKKVLIQSNSHISLHVGLQRAGSRIYYVMPEYDANLDIILAVTPDQIKGVLEEHPDIEAVYLTNPTYEGLWFDVPQMKEVVGDRLFIVDEAHGAHFYFSNECPQGALENNCADAAVTSLHKMLGTFYGTAIINVGKTGKVDKDTVRMMHQMMAAGDGSNTSPFYVADIESCVQAFVQDGQTLVGSAIRKAELIKEAIKAMKNIKLESIPGFQTDPTKFIITIKGLSGAQIWDLLEAKYKINIEKITKKAAIITVHAHINDEDVTALIAALQDIDQFEEIAVIDSAHTQNLGAASALKELGEDDSLQPLYKKVLNDRDLVLDIRDCFAADSEIVPINEALGRISCEIKYNCPPGFPVLLYGERISENHVKFYTTHDALSGKKTTVKVVIESKKQE